MSGDHSGRVGGVPLTKCRYTNLVCAAVSQKLQFVPPMVGSHGEHGELRIFSSAFQYDFLVRLLPPRSKERPDASWFSVVGGERDRERPAKNHRFVTPSHVVRPVQGAQPPEGVRCYLTFDKMGQFLDHDFYMNLSQFSPCACIFITTCALETSGQSELVAGKCQTESTRRET